MSELNQRCQLILQELLWNHEYMPLEVIGNKLGVSKRSVYYALNDINKYMVKHGLSEIQVQRGKGILLSSDEKKALEGLLGLKKIQSDYYFQPLERVKIIVLYIYYSQQAVYIEQLMECCQVSRNTVFADLKVVVNLLHEYDLELDYDSKLGYTISGDSIRARAVFLLLFNQVHHLYENGFLTFLPQEQIEVNLKKLQVLEQAMSVNYVDGCLAGIAVMLPLMACNNSTLLFPGLKREKIQSTEEYRLVQQHFPELVEDERIYLTLHLLGTRLNNSSAKLFDSGFDEDVYSITIALITEFERISCVQFENQKQLEQDLVLHIKSSMYRYKYGIQVGNPFYDDIVREYPQVFEITRIACKYLEKTLGIPMMDSEIAYLAMHFGANLRQSPKKQSVLRILVVCGNGVSIGNMLKKEVGKLLPDAQVVGVAAAVDVQYVQNICDLIISAVPIHCKVPVILVHPVLTDLDRQHILNHQLVMKRSQNHVEKDILKVLEQYVPKDSLEAVKRDISRCFNVQDMPLAEISHWEKGLLDYLHQDNIFIYDDHFTWQESIFLSGRKLLDGDIERGYLERIIAQTIKYGTYMFLNDNVMLAHAKPEDGVNRLSLQFNVFRQPVVFPNGRHAKLIILLAAEDQEKHLNILNDVFRLMQNEVFLPQLCQQNSSEDVLYIVKNSLV